MRYLVQNKTCDFQVKLYSFDLIVVPHIHNHLEMIYLVSGKHGSCWMADRIRPGRALFPAGANQTHFYENVEEAVSFRLILFSDAMDADIKKLLRGKITQQPEVTADQLPGDIREQLETIARVRASSSIHQRQEAKGRFLTLMGQVLAYCLEHFTQPITLDSTSRELHLSKYYVSHIFSPRMGRAFLKSKGMSPRAYIAQKTAIR